MDNIELSADPRQTLGKKVRFLRRQGLIPANLYGPAIESVPLQIEGKHILQALIKGGRNAVVAVNVNGEKSPRTTLIRGIQRDPRTDEILHIDLLQVDVTKTITALVPIILVGESPLTKGQMVVISQSLGSIEVEGLPTELPQALEVDISILTEIDQVIRVRDLPITPNITVLTDSGQLVVKAARGRIALELEEEAAEKAEAETEREAEAEGLEPEAKPASEDAE